MKSPVKIARALYLLGRKNNSDLISKAFLAYAKDKHLSEMLPKILYHLKNFARHNKIHNTAFVSSAFKLNNEIEKVVREFVGVESDSEINFVENKNLIGGFVVKYRGYLYDASIKNKLQKLKEELINQQ